MDLFERRIPGTVRTPSESPKFDQRHLALPWKLHDMCTSVLIDLEMGAKYFARGLFAELECGGLQEMDSKPSMRLEEPHQ
jgi:hypothetical protein